MGRPVRDPGVVLRPLRVDELPAFLERGRKEYRRQLVEWAGMAADAAERKAERDFVVGEGQSVYALEADGEVVGTLWYAVQGGAAYLYDVWVDPAQRGRGYGRAAMTALEDEVRGLGLPAIEFNVWAGNDVARSLYRSLGYTERAVFMRKEL